MNSRYYTTLYLTMNKDDHEQQLLYYTVLDHEQQLDHDDHEQHCGQRTG